MFRKFPNNSAFLKTFPKVFRNVLEKTLENFIPLIKTSQHTQFLCWRRFLACYSIKSLMKLINVY